jgi:hypothetical protein
VTLVVVGAVVFTGDDGDSASSCVTDLVGHLPADTALVTASDLAAARAAGYDDSSVDAMLDSSLEIGVVPDPLTHRMIQMLAGFDDAPYDPGDVRCWVGSDGSSFVARGAFDEQRVDGSGMELRLDGDLVTDSSTDPDLMTAGAPPAALVTITTALADEGALSYLVTAPPVGDGPGEHWVGVALARSQSWDLVVAWSYPDDDVAMTGEAAVRDALTSTSALTHMIDEDAVDVTDALERNGSIVILRAPLVGEPHTWARLSYQVDPVLRAGLSA